MRVRPQGRGGMPGGSSGGSFGGNVLVRLLRAESSACEGGGGLSTRWVGGEEGRECKRWGGGALRERGAEGCAIKAH